MSFKCTSKSQPGKTVLEFSGFLDENAALPPNTEVYKGDLLLDLGGVNLINSLGCRNWILWIKNLTAEGKITLISCSQSIIGQTNVLKGFLPDHIGVDSFYIHYACIACDKIDRILTYSKDVIVNGTITVPTERKCPHCGDVQQMEPNPQMYFQFLRR